MPKKKKEISKNPEEVKRAEEQENRRVNDSAMLVLLQTISGRVEGIDGKQDEMVKAFNNFSLSCGECNREFDRRLKPLESDYKDRTDASMVKKVKSFLLSPAFLVPAALTVLFYAVTFTNVLATGQLSSKIQSLEIEFKANKTNQITFDQLTNFIRFAKTTANNLQGGGN